MSYRQTVNDDDPDADLNGKADLTEIRREIAEDERYANIEGTFLHLEKYLAENYLAFISNREFTRASFVQLMEST